ncbi:sulfatase-like hydrolase/transferase [Parasphingorhabdus sp. JC815]|uniref:sulfatase-like hydrolase/transferase n=1 Tax=Parasphingorhabdus sp. JC815 TaxID=3232140 RepID=UPI00345988C2
MFTRRNVVKGGAASVLSGLLASSLWAKGPKAPNIIFILADDLGYADLSVFGREDFETPNLDRLAASGMALTRSYANSSVCSPTRLALMTGQYQYRYPGGLDEPLGVDPTLGLPADVLTFPDLLKKAGYDTSLVGKWHLGGLPEFGPLKSGYDRFWGIYQGGADYFDHGMTIHSKFTHDLWDGEKEIHRQGYLTDLITNQSLRELKHFKARQNPFLLSVHYTAPHWPWEGPEDEEIAAEIKNSFHYDGGNNATYAAMVKSLDDGVGRIMDALYANGQADNTIIVFTSDNGGERFSKIWPFRGMKGELLEGGIRVPTIFHWPGHIPAGTTSDLPNMTMDWVPTLLAAAGIEARDQIPLDGINLLPNLLSKTTGQDRTLFWRHNAQNQSAAAKGSWKYLSMSGHEFLFDLAADPREVANLKDKHPDIFTNLKSSFAKWNKEMLPYPENSFSYEFRGKGNIAGY